jgi:hypothetical protein
MGFFMASIVNHRFYSISRICGVETAGDIGGVGASVLGW